MQIGADHVVRCTRCSKGSNDIVRRSIRAKNNALRSILTLHWSLCCRKDLVSRCFSTKLTSADWSRTMTTLFERGCHCYGSSTTLEGWPSQYSFDRHISRAITATLCFRYWPIWWPTTANSHKSTPGNFCLLSHARARPPPSFSNVTLFHGASTDGRWS